MATAPLRFWFADLGAFGGVNTHKVMELVPVPAALLKQVPAGQGCKQPPRLGDRGINQRCGSGRADVLACVQTKQPEARADSGGRAR